MQTMRELFGGWHAVPMAASRAATALIGDEAKAGFNVRDWPDRVLVEVVSVEPNYDWADVLAFPQRAPRSCCVAHYNDAQQEFYVRADMTPNT